MSVSEKPVGVVGGGLGGLAAACVLAARGYRVLLLEKNETTGGKAGAVTLGEHRFDLGPTILTLPSVLARIFREAGEDMARELELIPLDPQWRCFFDDGSTLDLVRDPERMAAAADSFAPGSAPGYRRFMELSRRLHDVAERRFFWRSVGSLRDVFDWRSSFRASNLGDVLALRPGSTVHSAIRAHVRDARLAQMLDHFTQYVGSAPDQSPAVLCGIAHMQSSEGIWYPMGGTRAVATALGRLAARLGVEIRTGEEVGEILLDGAGGIEGVRTARGRRIPLAALVANSDIVRTHRDLLGGADARSLERVSRCEPACSGVVLYLGLSRRYEHLLHHNFIFSRDPEEELDSIYRRGEPSPDPSCYVCAPAGTEPSVAPPGGESLYVLVHAPYLRPGQDWRRMFPAYRRVILDKLRRGAGLESLDERIVREASLTPADIERRFSVLQGAIYGLASHGRFLGAFKPSNRSSAVKRLYFAGGSVHPGPGMPMVLMSGWIAAAALDEDGAVHRAGARVAGALS